MSDRCLGMVASRWRWLLAVTAACLIAVFGAASVQADQPQREFSFTGKATINGEPAPRGTMIGIEVNGKLIGEGEVSGDDGKWVVQIDASLLQDGVCEAVFYVDGQRADRQWNRCAVDIRLELGPEPADVPENQDELEDQAEPEDPDAADSMQEADEPPIELASDDPDESAPTVQPRSPKTGTGGLMPEQRRANWPAAPFVAFGAVALASLTVMLVRRRSGWSRR